MEGRGRSRQRHRRLSERTCRTTGDLRGVLRTLEALRENDLFNGRGKELYQ